MNTTPKITTVMAISAMTAAYEKAPVWLLESKAAYGIPSFRKRNQRQRRRDHRRIYCHGPKGDRK